MGEVFKGLVIAFSGTFAQTHKKLHALVVENGGKASENVTNEVTYLVATPDSVLSESWKVGVALGKPAITIVTIEWLTESISKGNRVFGKIYNIYPPESEAEKATGGKAATNIGNVKELEGLNKVKVFIKAKLQEEETARTDTKLKVAKDANTLVSLASQTEAPQPEKTKLIEAVKRKSASCTRKKADVAANMEVTADGIVETDNNKRVKLTAVGETAALEAPKADPLELTTKKTQDETKLAKANAPESESGTKKNMIAEAPGSGVIAVNPERSKEGTHICLNAATPAPNRQREVEALCRLVGLVRGVQTVDANLDLLDGHLAGIGLKSAISLDKSSQEFKSIAGYFDDTNGKTFEAIIGQIFRIELEVEKSTIIQKWDQYRPDNRRLVWHGSPVGNFQHILKTGLKDIGGFGGVFFSDTSGTSLAYCRLASTKYIPEPFLMFLCEIQVGVVPTHTSGTLGYNIGPIAMRLNDSGFKWKDAEAIHGNLRGAYMPDVASSKLKKLEFGCEWVVRQPRYIKYRYIIAGTFNYRRQSRTK